MQNTLGEISYLKKTVFFIFLSISSFSQEIIVFSDSLEKAGPKPGYRWKNSYLSNFRTENLTSPYLDFDLPNVQTKIYYSPEGNDFNVKRKIDSYNAINPQNLSFNEYSSIQNTLVRKSLIREYERLADGNSAASGRGLNPLLKSNKVLDELFGGKIPNFMPNGFLSVDLKLGSRTVNNPNNTIQFRKQPVFDIDQQIAINFDNLLKGITGGRSIPGIGGNKPNLKNIPGIGGLNSGGDINDWPNPMNQMNSGLGGYVGPREKLNIDGNFDTKAAFNFENKMKIDFRNNPEDILQKIEAGNVSMPNRSQLIPGVENLFGVKAALRFGKLDLTTVLAQQQSNIESIVLSGGNKDTPFEFKVDTYEENRHFFLGHFFRNNFERSLKSLPMVLSGVQITRVEAYVTNRTNSVASMRNVIGITSLGEETKEGSTNKEPADNTRRTLSNQIYQPLENDPKFRDSDYTAEVMNSLNLANSIDYEVLKSSKKLSENEFKINRELGYISLLTPLRNDEILAVAYEYTYNGQTYKVGELTEDYSARPDDQVIMLKLLKSSTIRNHLEQPMWDLMMKNIYSLGLNSVIRDGFRLRIIYKDDKTGVDSPFLQDANSVKDTPLIELLALDKLNFNNDPQKDGNFDFVTDVTIEPQYGKLVFPLLEPFGSYMRDVALKNEPEEIKNKYTFTQLYDGTLTDAQQVTTQNKFFINGSVKSDNREILLPLGASPASVKVYSGGIKLSPGSDYVVDSQLGTIRITNQSILNSSRQIRIDFERPDLFRTQIRRMIGLRADYMISPYLRLGGTLMSLKEQTPAFLTRAAIGKEPVNNTLFGFDLGYNKKSMGLTRLIDKLPIVSANEPSTVIVNAEIAQLRPGVNNNRVSGNAMIDDFEASRNSNDLTRQVKLWKLGSVPEELQANSDGSPYQYNYNRALISAYTIDPTVYQNFNGSNNTVGSSVGAGAEDNVYEKSYRITDILKGMSRPAFGLQLPVGLLDISYFPTERGMYNYNPNLANFIANPRDNFGSIMRGLTFDADFENSNVEYIEFWLLDPFQDVVRSSINEAGNRNTTGGKFVIQLGNVSEDVIPDNQSNFENGLPGAKDIEASKKLTNWGYAPSKNYVNDAFDLQEDTRALQDVGLEGLSNTEEREFDHIKKFLNSLDPSQIGLDLYNKIINDPSGDDYEFFLNSKFDENKSTLVTRYKHFMGMENNSPVVNNNNILSQTNSNLADKEDLNQDNTISTVESYYSYELDLKPNSLAKGSGFVVDKVTANGGDFYLFRIPIDKYTGSKDINGFKSVRFARIVMQDWQEPVVLRFATFNLVANQYRKYKQVLNNEEEVTTIETEDAGFESEARNIEANGCPDGEPNCTPDGIIPYMVPPGFIRDRDFTQQTNNIQFNEQSISLKVSKLKPQQARGVFKNIQTSLNMYKRLKMFIHAESKNNDVAGAFIRIGTDLQQNYYEIQIPRLVNTIYSKTLVPEAIWPAENNIDIGIDELRALKVEKLKSGTPYDQLFVRNIIGPNGQNYQVTIKGNPDLNSIQTMMLGVINSNEGGLPIQCELWMDELRAFGFDQTSGYSSYVSTDIKLSDIGTLSLNAARTTYGFGGVQDRISTRTRDYTNSFGFATSLALDRFLPYKWNMQIPFFSNYDKQTITPEFDPLNPDLHLQSQVLNNIQSDLLNNYKQKVTDISIRKGFNFTDVRRIRNEDKKGSHFYDIENLSVSYAQSAVKRSNVSLADFTQKENKGGIAYVFSPKQKFWEPFKDNEKYDKQSLLWLKEFNLNLIPTLIGIRYDFNRQYLSSIYWENAAVEGNQFNLDTVGVQPNVIKYFLNNRSYDLNWDLTRALSLSYKARGRAIVDEDEFGIEARQIKEKFNLGSVFRNNRMQNYAQNIDFRYTFPLDKFFLTDWLIADGGYNIMYNYRANSFGLREILDSGEQGDLFGNFLENGRDWNVNGQFDLVKLYNKFKYLKRANEPNAEVERFTRAPGDDENFERQQSDVAKSITRLLMAVRGINFSVTNHRGTLMPGFSGTSGFFGTFGSGSLPFVLGSQRYKTSPLQGNGWLNQFENNNWLTAAQTRNDPFIQNKLWKYEYSTSVQPWEGFRMQINGKVSRGDDYQILYRADEFGQFSANNIVRNGNFSTTFWSFKTLFKRLDKDPNSGARYTYEVFNKMNEYRETITNYLNKNFATGEATYSNVSQDVLIPAFYAAYAGKSSGQLGKFLNKNYNTEKRTTKTPFIGAIPLPNWRIDWGGIESVGNLTSAFKKIGITHSYSSEYSVGNYTSNLSYQVDYLMNLLMSDYPLGNLTRDYNIASATGNDITTITSYSPVFIMSTVNLVERFSPLLGLNFSTQGNFSGSFEYNKERRASLNLSNVQVAEYHANSFSFTAGLKKKNVRLPFRNSEGGPLILKNDLNFTMRVTINDIIALQRRIDGDATVTQGNKNIQIRPQVQYQFNERLSGSMYFEFLQNSPYNTLTYFSQSAIGGVNMRFNLNN